MWTDTEAPRGMWRELLDLNAPLLDLEVGSDVSDIGPQNGYPVGGMRF